MVKELEELMQKTVISEDKELTLMVEDIEPIGQTKFTDLEIEANKKQEFSIVVYKKENIFKRIFKNIKFTLEALRIMKHSQEFDYVKNRNK